MKIIALFLAISLLSVLGWQQLRYLKARRGPVQDRQSLLYGSSAFHVVTLLRVAEGADVLEALRKLHDDIEAGGSAKLVYAGRVAFVGLQSAQLPEVDWDAVILVQHASRDRYDAMAASALYSGALGSFADHYSHGLDRSALLNLGIPWMLLGVRAYEIARREPSHYPFVPASRMQLANPAAPDRVARLDAFRELSEDAVVVMNFLKGGTAEQRSADRAYGLKMAGMFAEGVHGPMHMGTAVTLEGDARFDRVALVYYPGIDYMQEMLTSTFFNGIVGDKQPGDTLAALTVPVLSRL